MSASRMLATPSPSPSPSADRAAPAPIRRLAGRRVFVAGHRGLVGAALVRRLDREGCTVLTAPRAVLDLERADAVDAWMTARRPEIVVLAAARVGGIAANIAAPADFLESNLRIQTNVLSAARRAGVATVLFLGSSCVYPRAAPQPIAESALMAGPPEPTNHAYAVAKLAGIALCRALAEQHGLDAIVAMPANLYGPGDRYDPEAGHVVAALIDRMHKAKAAGAPAVAVWGTGRPRREFLHVDDCADALIFLLRHHRGPEPINVGTGSAVTIADLARRIASVVGYGGRLAFDPARPDGVPEKCLDVSRLAALGWRARIDLDTGLADAYRAYRASGGGVR